MSGFTGRSHPGAAALGARPDDGALVDPLRRGRLPSPRHEPRRQGTRGGRVLLLRTRGRRSGQVREVLVAYVELDKTPVICGANGGCDRVPAWFVNLRPAGRSRSSGTGAVSRSSPWSSRATSASRPSRRCHGPFPTSGSILSHEPVPSVGAPRGDRGDEASIPPEPASLALAGCGDLLAAGSGRVG